MQCALTCHSGHHPSNKRGIVLPRSNPIVCLWHHLPVDNIGSAGMKAPTLGKAKHELASRTACEPNRLPMPLGVYVDAGNGGPVSRVLGHLGSTSHDYEPDPFGASLSLP